MNDFDIMRIPNVRYAKQREMIALADWLIDNRCTVRQLSKEFDIPRSTVHKRLTHDLREVDYDKWKQCRTILELNGKEAVMRMVKANK